MNKSLLMFIFAIGLIGSNIQPVGTNDLIRAVKSSDADKFGKLLEQYDDIQEQDMLTDIKGLLSAVDLYQNLYGKDEHFGKYSMVAMNMLLFYAVEMKKYSLVRYLLADLNLNPEGQEPFEGNTLLMLAIDNSDYDMAYLLLRYGARVDIVNLEGKTAFDIAKGADKTPKFTSQVLTLLNKYRSNTYR